MWNTLVVTPMAQALEVFGLWLAGLGVPYHFGFAIILFTIAIRLITLPLSLKQVRSMKATQELQPQLQELQKKHGKDKEKLSKAQMELYKEAGINPLGGCLPMLIQMPILFGMYGALYKLTDNLDLGGFLWIPDLAFPGRGEGISWLFPFPPAMGWGPALAYLVLPILTVITQVVVQRMTQTTAKSQDPQQGMMSNMMMIMPLFFGYITLQVPAGLTLYWVVSNIFSVVQQYFITGWGGLLPASLREKTKAIAGSEGSTSKASSTASGGSDGGGADEAASEGEKKTTAAKKGKKRGKRRKKR